MKQLPKIYVVESNRKGVKKPVERQVTSIDKNVAFRIDDNRNIPIDRYNLDNSQYPYYVDILTDNMSSSDDGYASGFGDLWQWTYYSSLSKDDADKFYTDESNRVKIHYQIKDNMSTNEVKLLLLNLLDIIQYSSNPLTLEFISDIIHNTIDELPK